MYATVRRYEGIDKVRSVEIATKVNETLVPSLGELPGFAGYYLIEAGEGVFASISLFADAKQAHESTRVAARWVREQELEEALPNTPMITAGLVVAHAAAIVDGVLTRPSGDRNPEQEASPPPARSVRAAAPLLVLGVSRYGVFARWTLRASRRARLPGIGGMPIFTISRVRSPVRPLEPKQTARRLGSGLGSVNRTATDLVTTRWPRRAHP